jgi:hypothetical protein
MRYGKQEIQAFWQGVLDLGIVTADLETVEFEKAKLGGAGPPNSHSRRLLTVVSRHKGSWREEKLMRKKRLSRELESTEVPEDADESLPEATPVHRGTPDSILAGGAEHRAGVEQEEPHPPPEETITSEDPPRGRKSSGGQ